MKLFCQNKRFEKVFLIVLSLMIFGVVIQAGVFKELDSEYGVGNWYIKTILYDVVGLTLIIIMRTLFSKIMIDKINAYLVLLIYCIGILVLKLVMQDNFIMYQMILYYYLFFYPIIFAMCVCTNGKKENKGILMSCLICVASVVYFYYMGSNDSEICVVMITSIWVLGMAIKKNVIGDNKYKLILGTLAILLIAIILWCFGRTILYPYEIQNYLADGIKNSLIVGDLQLENSYLGTILYSDYIINSTFSYYGILIGVVLIFLLGLLIFTLFKISMRINKNMLIANAVSVQIGISSILCIIGNLGIVYSKELSVPYLGYGLVNSIVYSVLIGIVLGLEGVETKGKREEK